MNAMNESTCTLRTIARIHTDFPTKFGVPRQAGLVEELEGLVVFEPAFRDPEALRGLEGFSHLWLIWQFSRNLRDGWSPTVRPPRLGGNARLGVFATRAPFRPNPLGLSCVRLLTVEDDPKLGRILRVAGADLVDGTPIYDIKPYLPYADCRPEATAGFAPDGGKTLRVETLPGALDAFPAEKLPALRAVLARDPRPRYQDDPARVYGMAFAGYDLRFSVEGDTLTVIEAVPIEK